MVFPSEILYNTGVSHKKHRTGGGRYAPARDGIRESYLRQSRELEDG